MACVVLACTFTIENTIKCHRFHFDQKTSKDCTTTSQSDVLLIDTFGNDHYCHLNTSIEDRCLDDSDEISSCCYL